MARAPSPRIPRCGWALISAFLRSYGSICRLTMIFESPSRREARKFSAECGSGPRRELDALFLIRQARRKKQGSAGFSFGGRLQAEHQLAPGRGAGNEIIRCGLPPCVGIENAGLSTW